MKKRLVTLFLVLTVCLTMVIPAYAANNMQQTPRETMDIADQGYRIVQNNEAISILMEKKDYSYSYETTEESYALHRKEFVCNDNGVAKGFTCTRCNYCSWKAVPEPPVVTE